MKKILFILAFLAVSSLSFAQNINVQYQRQEPDSEFHSDSPGVMSTFNVSLNGTLLGEIYVSRYDNGVVRIENGTNCYVRVSVTAYRKGEEKTLGPVWLCPANGDSQVAVSQNFGGTRFKRTTLHVHKIKY